jgi:hypothetical protein
MEDLPRRCLARTDQTLQTRSFVGGQPNHISFAHADSPSPVLRPLSSQGKSAKPVHSQHQI